MAQGEGRGRPGAAAARWRLAALACALVLALSLPFVLWGERFDRAAPQWLEAFGSDAAFAAFGIALLIVDVLLPVPSTLVAMALCWRLGPWWGGACVAAGFTLSFVVGYALGRSVPEARLRRWIGPALWDRVRDRADRRALWWISLMRPLPVLSEASAVLAGVWRLPPLPAFAAASAASLATAALYAASAALGRDTPGLPAALLCALALPAALWLLHRRVVARLLGRAAEASPAAQPMPAHGPPAQSPPAQDLPAHGRPARGMPAQRMSPSIHPDPQEEP